MHNASQPGKDPYAAFDIVVIAASAGGIQALVPLLESLPSDFSTPIVVVHHLPPASRHVSRLKEILQRRTRLQVKWAEDGECLLPGTVYLSPQDRTTAIDVQTGCLAVSGSGELRVARPTADALFFSAAEAFGSRAMAVVLSGALSDGADGSASIARAGGRVLAQIASEAQFSDMPAEAMRRSRVGLAFDSVSLARVIANLVMIPGVAAWFGIGKAGVCAPAASRLESLHGTSGQSVGVLTNTQ